MAYDDLMAFRSQVRYDLCSGADMCDLLPGRAAQGISPKGDHDPFFHLIHCFLQSRLPSIQKQISAKCGVDHCLDGVHTVFRLIKYNGLS